MINKNTFIAISIAAFTSFTASAGGNKANFSTNPYPIKNCENYNLTLVKKVEDKKVFTYQFDGCKNEAHTSSQKTNLESINVQFNLNNDNVLFYFLNFENSDKLNEELSSSLRLKPNEKIIFKKSNNSEYSFYLTL